MKPYLLLLSFVALASFTPAIVAAGEIRGILRTKDGKPVTDATIVITQGNNRHSTRPNQYGYYKIFVSEKGKCNVTVEIGQQHCSLDAPVDSFDASVQYDLILEMGNGDCKLTRKDVTRE